MPVIECMRSVTESLMIAGKAGVSARLFELVARLAGQVECMDVRGAGLARSAGSEVCLAEAVERLGFAEPVLVLAGDRPGLLQVIDGQLAVALPELGSAQVGEHPPFAGPVFGFAKEAKSPGEMPRGAPVAAQAHVEVTDQR